MEIKNTNTLSHNMDVNIIDTPSSKTELKQNNIDKLYSDSCDVLLLYFKNNNFNNSEKFYETKIIGKKMIDYVKSSLSDYNYKTVKISTEKPLLDQLKKHISNKKYTALFFCDTPFITSETVNFCIEYTIMKDLDYCKLHRGHIFKSNKISELNQSDTYTFDYNKEEFYSISSLTDLSYAENKLQEIVISNHMKNGVRIIKPETLIIDPTVIIEPNTLLYPYSIITGNTVIKKNTIIYENSRIENCIIRENCKIHTSNLINCVVHKNTVIKPYSVYSNVLIKK